MLKVHAPTARVARNQPVSGRVMNVMYFDDFTAGMRFASPAMTVTESAIIDFAALYDPQPFHIDRVAALQSPYGGLIASGFQTLAVCFRMFLALGIIADSGLGSPGIDELRWLAPVRPDDTLHATAEVLDVRPSSTRTDRGYVTMAIAAVNQRGETVLTFKTAVIIARR